MKRKLISWITILTFAMTIFPVLPHAAEAEPATEVYLGDTQLESGKYYAVTDNTITESTSENYNVYYVDGTLTLQDLTYSGSGNHGQYSYTVLSANGDITLVVEGDNTITNNDGNSGRYGRSGMYVEGNLTIQGAGDLIVNAGDTQEAGSDSTTRYFSHGLDATGTLTFSGAGHVNFIGGNMNNENTASAGICAPVINVNGTGTLEATGGSDNGDNANTENWGIFGTYYDGDSIITVTNGKLIATTGKTYSQTVEGTSIGLQTDSLVINGGQVDIKTAQCASGYGIYIHASDGNELNELSLSNGSLNIVAQGTNYSRGIKSLTNSADALFSITGGTFVAVSNAMAQDTMAVDLYENEDEFKVTTENRMWRYGKDDPYIYSGTVTSERHTYLEIRDSDGQSGEMPTPVESDTFIGGLNLEEGAYYIATSDGEEGYTQLTKDSASASAYNVYYADGVLTFNNLNYTGNGADRSEYDCAIAVDNDVTIKMIGTNTVTYKSETNQGTNAGLYVHGDLHVIGAGNLTINGGDIAATGSDVISCGILMENGSITFDATGELVANGGNMNDDSSRSIGIYAFDQPITVNSGTLKGNGGNIASDTYGNRSTGIECNSGEITVKSGTLIATGGSIPSGGTAENSFSLGLRGSTISVEKGRLDAIGGSAEASTGLYVDIGGWEVTDFSAIDSTLNLKANAPAQSYALDIGSTNAICEIKNSTIIADGGDGENSIAIMAVDEIFRSAMSGCMWKYDESSEYIYRGELTPEKHKYIEIKPLDKDLSENAPTLSQNTIIYGQTLSDIKLSGSINSNGETVEGTYTWDAPDKMPDAGTYQAAWTFTPTDTSKHEKIEGMSIIIVEKAKLQATKIDLWQPITHSGQTLDDVGLTISFAPIEYGHPDGLFLGGEKVWDLPENTEVLQGVSYGWTIYPREKRNYTSFSGSTVLWPEVAEDPDEPDTPSTPSQPSSPSQPSEPEQTAPDVTTDEGTSTTTTTAKPDVTTSGTTASATVSEAMGEAIVEQATENESNTVVIAPEMDSDITEAEVVVPAGTVEALGDDTDADLVIDTPVGKVTLPNSGLSALAKDTDDITVSLKADGDTLEFVIADDAGAVATVNGGVKLVVPADTKAGTVAVIVNADGTREVVRKSVASDDNMIIPLDGSATIEIVDNSKDFVDVAANSWYSDAVAFASSHELFNGTSATEFSPDAGMTRGMLAAVLSNFERGDGSGLDAAFDDVADDAWYAEAIAWAAENGIVNGLGNGMFGPEELITREQMAAMLYNYADMLGVDTSARANLNAYSDADSVSSWANEVMSWANATGIIGGTTTTTLDPQGTATRAQVAAMLERFVLLIAE